MLGESNPFGPQNDHRFFSIIDELAQATDGELRIKIHPAEGALIEVKRGKKKVYLGFGRGTVEALREAWDAVSAAQESALAEATMDRLS